MKRSLLKSIGLVMVGAIAGWTLHAGLRPSDPAFSPTAAPRLHEQTAATPLPLEPSEPEPPAAEDSRIDFWLSSAFHFYHRTQSLEDLVAELQASTEDPRELIGLAIERTSDEDLISITSAITRIDDEALRRSHDVRAFARRLAEVAIEGIADETSEVPDSGEVNFALSAANYEPEWGSQQAFAVDHDKIYAIISLPDYEENNVMVKWSHLESGRILALSQHRVSREDPVWTWNDPAGDWLEGTYRVDVYSSDDSMLPLARGEYVVE